MSEQDAVELKSLGKQGVKIYFQSMPGEKEILLDTILGKYFKNIKLTNTIKDEEVKIWRSLRLDCTSVIIRLFLVV